MTRPESCGMSLYHCLPRVPAAPWDHGMQRDTFQVFMLIFTSRKHQWCLKWVIKRVRRADKRLQLLHASTLWWPNTLPGLLFFFFFFLSTKPHPAVLTTRSCGDRHIRILFSFEGLPWKRWHKGRVAKLFFQSALIRRLLSWIGAQKHCSPCPSVPGHHCCYLNCFLPPIHFFQSSGNLEEVTLNWHVLTCHSCWLSDLGVLESKWRDMLTVLWSTVMLCGFLKLDESNNTGFFF